MRKRDGDWDKKGLLDLYFIMTFIDKISVLEANTITTKVFEETWGMTREEYLDDFREFLLEQRNEKGLKDEG